MLVYEHVDNGNLDQWLHGDVGSVSPLSWDIHMNIILGTETRLAYLHEGLEPKVVHRDVKSNNKLVGRQCNPKVSHIGLVMLPCSETSYMTTRVMGTIGDQLLDNVWVSMSQSMLAPDRMVMGVVDAHKLL